MDDELLSKHATKRLSRALGGLKSNHGTAQNYSALDELQQVLIHPTSPPDPDVLEAFTSHLLTATGHELPMRQALAQALYSALRSDARATAPPIS